MSADSSVLSLFRGLSNDTQDNIEEVRRGTSLELPLTHHKVNDSSMDIILEDSSMTVSGATAPTMVANLNRKLNRAGKAPIPTIPSIRHIVKWREKHIFDVSQLPEDMYRLYNCLKESFGESYALHIIFTMRTAIELHRAWHMTLLTSKVLQQLKDKFQLRMTWTLGVVKLQFRVEDGDYQLNRKVPYDYDSEFQDIYMKIAVALIEGHVDIHKALRFQTETKQGKHTAKSGLFLRDYPGRLVLYPLESATCAVIFFGGDWKDGAVAAVTGLAAGLVEMAVSYWGTTGKVILDVLVGIVTGTIAGLFYRHDGPNYCLSSIFLGTLYWFFYGTAFVIGLLEIIAGELETGVTRFVAVSVKTFVLCLGAGFGMMLTLEDSQVKWVEQASNCGTLDLHGKWWRIPLYLLCSASALGQYRFPIVDYWRGLAIQLVAYEVQYQLLTFYENRHERDNMDYATSNAVGAMAATIGACALSFFINRVRHSYYARLLHRDGGKSSKVDTHLYWCMACLVQFADCLKLGRKTDRVKIEMEKKLKQRREEVQRGNSTEIMLNEEEEDALVEALVGSQNLNIWAILMPAVYQLVPGSMIAKLWFNSIFPPPLNEQQYADGSVIVHTIDEAQENVFANLMVISTSLALGLLLGFAIVDLFYKVFIFLTVKKIRNNVEERKGIDKRKCLSEEHLLEIEARNAHMEEAADRFHGMFTSPDEDPSDTMIKEA